ncbi:MAG TPA: hypothetical protein VJH94_04740 [Candidatus Paceibacterota bacterium]
MGDWGEMQETHPVDFDESPIAREELIEAVRAFQKETKKSEKRKAPDVSGTAFSPSSADKVQALHGDEGAIPDKQTHVKFEEFRKEQQGE